MTIDEFLERLEARHLKWELRRGRIRTGFYTEDCPISAVSGRALDFADPWNGGKCLGLSSTDAGDIVCASDDRSCFYADLRSRLLKACGLPESEPP